MPISPGTRLGSYEIIAPLGAGGMGEVYRARDTVLKRDVALKVLPAALARDPERMARFQREAELLASLNHPNIAILHGLVESDGQRALVMELVPGETLGDRIKRGPMALEEALKVARQMAEALEAAHDKGVVHRDLKPGNVMITPDGLVQGARLRTGGHSPRGALDARRSGQLAHANHEHDAGRGHPGHGGVHES
jgi:serine/threonine protein kinase